MGLKSTLLKLLGKDTAKTATGSENESETIKFYDDKVNAESLSSNAPDHGNVKPITVTAGKFPNYEKVKAHVQKISNTVPNASGLDIVVLIKERQEGVRNLVRLLKIAVNFPPSETDDRLYKYLMPLFNSGENQGKVNRSARYGDFKEHQQELVTYFDGSDNSKGTLIPDLKENQKVLSILSWIMALKNFAITQSDTYAALINDLYTSNDLAQMKLANVLVMLAESSYTDAIVGFTGTVRKPEFKILLEDAFRQWYKCCLQITQVS